MFEISVNVRYSEVGSDGFVTPFTLLNYLQDCVTAHSDSLGMTLDWYAVEKKAWFLTYMQVDCKRMPGYGEELRIQTQPYRFMGALGFRSFRIINGQDEVLAVANTQWGHMDTSAMRLSEPDETEKSRYGLGAPFPMECLPTNLRCPKTEGINQESFRVHRTLLDTNGHMNNSQYIRCGMDYLPEEVPVMAGVQENGAPIFQRFCVAFKKAAMLGDMIVPTVYAVQNPLEEAKQDYIVALNDESGKPYAIIGFYRCI